MWLDAEAGYVNDSDPWHWINGQPSETSCDNGIVYKSRCYKIHREPVDWFTAVNKCLSKTASLAVFDDEILNYFTSRPTLLSGGRPGSLWVGLIKSWWTWPGSGGADVLYNIFNVSSNTPPEGPPWYTNSEYNCLVHTTTGYWRLSRCTERQRVVCQSDGPFSTAAETTTTTTTTTTIKNEATTGLTRWADETSPPLTGQLSTITTTAIDDKESDALNVMLVIIIAVVGAVVVIVVIVAIVIAVVRRSNRQRSSQTGDSSHSQPTATTDYETINPSRSDIVVYDHIQDNVQLPSGNARPNLHPNNDYENIGDDAHVYCNQGR